MTQKELKLKVETLLSANIVEQTKIIEQVALDFSQGLAQASDKSEYIKKSATDLGEVIREVLPITA